MGLFWLKHFLILLTYFFSVVGEWKCIKQPKVIRLHPYYRPLTILNLPTLAGQGNVVRDGASAGSV